MSNKLKLADQMKDKQRMFFEKNRLQTFNKWIYSADKKCSAAKLAEAGFYFIGSKKENDLVECFMCRKKLDGWEEDDDPWLEHIKHASHCSFASNRRQENDYLLVDFLEMHRGFVEKLFDEYSDELAAQFDKQMKSVIKYVKKSKAFSK